MRSRLRALRNAANRNDPVTDHRDSLSLGVITIYCPHFRVGDNQIGLEACLQQPLEARNSKLRRAAKKNVHDCGVVLLTTDN